MAKKSLAAAKGRVSPTISLNGSIGTGYSGLAKDFKGINITWADTTGITTGGDYVLTPTYQTITADKPFADQYRDNANRSIGLTLSVPLYNGLQTHTAIKNAKLNAMNAKYNQELTEQNLYKTIAQAYAISAFDFNTAKTRLANSQSNLLQAKYDYLFKLKVIDFYMGKPLTF
jgi:outer membrane protein